MMTMMMILSRCLCLFVHHDHCDDDHRVHDDLAPMMLMMLMVLMMILMLITVLIMIMMTTMITLVIILTSQEVDHRDLWS